MPVLDALPARRGIRASSRWSMRTPRAVTSTRLDAAAEPALLPVLDGVTDRTTRRVPAQRRCLAAHAVVVPKDRAAGLTATGRQGERARLDTVPSSRSPTSRGRWPR
jgi:hypothetical protein